MLKRVFEMSSVCATLILVAACGNNQNPQRSESSAGNRVCYPTVGDSLSFIGQTRYTKSTDNFDSVYSDTIKLFHYSDNYFVVQIKEIKYKWLDPLPGQSLSPIEFSRLRDSFEINDNNKYEMLLQGNGTINRISISLAVDSLYFNDFNYDSSTEVIENHAFRGMRAK